MRTVSEGQHDGPKAAESIDAERGAMIAATTRDASCWDSTWEPVTCQGPQINAPLGNAAEALRHSTNH